MDMENKITDFCVNNDGVGTKNTTVENPDLPLPADEKTKNGSEKLDCYEVNEDEDVSKTSNDNDRNEEENKLQERPTKDLISTSETQDEPPTEARLLEKDAEKNLDFNQIVYGFQPRGYYEHNKMLTDLVDVTYNPRTREFIFLDTRGICTWNKDGLENTVSRPMSFPKYQNRLLRKVIYARKYNVYFCLGKDFSLRVLNRNFDETCSVSSGLSSVMFLLFNPVRDELITGGVKGTKIWEFRQVADRVWREIKPMANYALFLKKELTDVGGSWVKKVELDQHLQHLYCCSETNVHCYDMEGRLLFKLENAHRMTITGCRFSPKTRVLITSSADTDVKIWSLTGGLVTTFRGHAKPITNLLLHPESSSLVLTCSMDGTVRLWSLDIMDCLYVIQVATDGVEWMGLTGERLLWTSTRRNLTVWSLNTVTSFWALARCKVKQLKVVHGENKTSRVMAVGDDSSVRFISKKERKNLSTVLPPPPISPLKQLLSVTYSREHSSVFILINQYEVWVYTTKTDPATRTAVWNLYKLQQMFQQKDKKTEEDTESSGNPVLRPSSGKSGGMLFGHGPSQTHRATAGGVGIETISECHTLCSLSSACMFWTEEGHVCPDTTNFLLLGMQDGRILFMDPVTYGVRHLVLQANKDAILDIRHNEEDGILISQCHPREDTLFQCWHLPSLELLYEVTTPTTITDFALIGNVFLCGHSTGSVQIQELKQIDPATHGKFGYHSSISDVSDVSSDQTSVLDGHGGGRAKKQEHLAPVVCVQACHRLQIFLTCSTDGMIKIWDISKTLQTEILLGESLTTAGFLNQTGDLLVGFRSHIFFIDHSKVLPSHIDPADVQDDQFEIESDIYEDPAVRYEGAAANPDPIDMKNYLVPFELDFGTDFQDKLSSTPTHSSDEDDAESDGELSMAPTEIYMSPIGSPRRLSRVDLLMSPDFSAQDLKKKAAAYRKRTKSRRVVFQGHDSGQIFEMPVFGESPCSSPAPTPPSSVSDVEEQQDELNEETDGEDEESAKEEEVTFKPIEKLEESTPAAVIEIPEVKKSPLKSKPSRFDLSQYKIDSKALMKDAPKEVVASPTKKAETPETTVKPAVASGRVIQKKQMKAERTRVAKKVKTLVPPGEETPELEQQQQQQQEKEQASPFMVSHKEPVRKEPTQKKQPATLPNKKAVNQQVQKSTTSAVITLEAPDSAVKVRSGMKPSKTTVKVKKTSVADQSYPSNKPIVSVSPTADVEQSQSVAISATDNTTADNKVKECTTPATEEITQSIKDTKTEDKIYFTDVDKGKSKGTTDVYRAEHRMTIPRKHSPTDIPPVLDTYEDETDEEPELMALTETEDTTPAPKTIQQLFLTQESQAVHESRSSDKIRQRTPSTPSAGKERAPIIIPSVTRDEDDVTADTSSGKVNPVTEMRGRLHPGKRPQTAHVTFQDRSEYGDEIIRKYKSCPTTPCDLYSRETWFEDYQEKLIKRDQMLKAQRQYRMENAYQKRRLLELRQRERRRALLGHKFCEEGYNSESALDRDLRTQSETALNALRRQTQSATPETSAFSSSSSKRPTSAFAKFKEQEDLAANRPFRVSLSKSPTQIKTNDSEVFVNTPGDGRPMVIKRPTKSMPSKCRRYVLVSHRPVHPPYPKPTALEEHLLPNRFPKDMKRWKEFKDYVKNGLPEDPHMMFGDVDDFMNSSWK